MVNCSFKLIVDAIYKLVVEATSSHPGQDLLYVYLKRESSEQIRTNTQGAPQDTRNKLMEHISIG